MSERLAPLSSPGSISARQTTATSGVISGPCRNNAGSGVADGAGEVMAHRSAYGGSKIGACCSRREQGRDVNVCRGRI